MNGLHDFYRFPQCNIFYNMWCFWFWVLPSKNAYKWLLIMMQSRAVFIALSVCASVFFFCCFLFFPQSFSGNTYLSWIDYWMALLICKRQTINNRINTWTIPWWSAVVKISNKENQTIHQKCICGRQFFFFSFHFWFITFTQHFSWNAMLRFWNGHIFCLSFVQSMFWCVFWFEMSLRWKYHVVLTNGSTLFRAGMNDFFWWNASNCKIIKFMLIRTFDHAIWSTSSSGGSIFMW